MKKYLLWAFGLAFFSVPVFAQPPRLTIWITPFIAGADAAQCRLAPEALARAELGAPTLTEQDVAGWQPETASIRLAPARFGGGDAFKLADHCFVLALDGKRLVGGAVLLNYSARLIEFPALVVSPRNGVLELQLRSVFRGPAGGHLLYREQLDEMLRAVPQPGRTQKSGEPQNPCSPSAKRVVICDF